MRKKSTPLQDVSFQERGTPATTLQEELSAGFQAYDYLRQKNDPELFRMLNMYVLLATHSMLAQGNASQQSVVKNDFMKVSKKLFKRASKVNAFKDTRVLTSALLQAIEYLMKNPHGEYREIAIKLIQELDGTAAPLGAPSNSVNSNSSILSVSVSVLFFILILKLVTGRSV